MTRIPFKDKPEHADKSFLITGGNGALGYATAKYLLRADPSGLLVITSRSRTGAVEAAAQLRQETGYEHIMGMSLDLASLSGIRDFVQRWVAQGLPPLHALVLNAAIQATHPQSYTEDGFEMNFGVNHLGNFLLVNLLLPHLYRPGRIVFVSSGTHDPNDWLARATGVPVPRYRPPEQLAYPERYPDAGAPRNAASLGRMRYATSKLCNILTTYELSRKLASGITVNAFDPGLMPGTGLARDANPLEQLAWKRVLPALRFVLPNVNTPERSGENLSRLVLDPALRKVTGTYVALSAPRPSSAESYDRTKATELWAGSKKLVQLAAGEAV